MSSFLRSLRENLSGSRSQRSEFSQLYHYGQKMRRNPLIMGMTIIFKSLQKKKFNFQDYRAEGPDSLITTAGPKT